MDPPPAEGPFSTADAVVAALLRSGAVARLGHGRDTSHRLRRLRVRRVMRPPPLAVDPEMTVAEVEERMASAGAAWLPVIEEGHLVGIVTLADLEAALALRALEPTGGSRSGAAPD